MIDLSKLIEPILDATEIAGETILSYFGQKELLNVSLKEDSTLITQADLASHDIIIKEIQQITPDIPIISEEDEVPEYDQRKDWPYCWIVDPLDGTRGFVDNSEEFSINIALVEKDKAIFGIIYAPISKMFYYAYSGSGAYKYVKNHKPQQLHTKPINWSNLKVLVGQYYRSKRMAAIEALVKIQIIRLNSALKFGAVADAIGDIYPRYGPTCEWDTAAGQCILEEAGGIVVDLNGQTLTYNKASMSNPAFLATGDPSQVDRVLGILREANNK